MVERSFQYRAPFAFEPVEDLDRNRGRASFDIYQSSVPFLSSTKQSRLVWHISRWPSERGHTYLFFFWENDL